MKLSSPRTKPLSVTVGIPAYNAQENIIPLLDSINLQRGGDYILDKIIVYDDQSADRTAELVSSYRSALVHLVRAPKRGGFAAAAQYLLTRSTSDITVLLNDDILIIGHDFLEKTITPFKEPEVGLVCANPQPYPATNFVERAVESGFRSYERAKLQLREGNSSLTCDGKTMNFSKKFIKSIDFPRDLSVMGNVDTYMYCMCVLSGFKYRFVADARVGFKNPSTVRDLTKWTLRNNDSLSKIRSRFGTILDEDYKRASHYFRKHKVAEFANNPLGCLLLFMITMYCSIFLKLAPSKFTPTWSVVSTTKTLSPITRK